MSLPRSGDISLDPDYLASPPSIKGKFSYYLLIHYFYFIIYFIIERRTGIVLIFRWEKKFDHWEPGFCYWEWEIKSPWCEWDLNY